MPRGGGPPGPGDPAPAPADFFDQFRPIHTRFDRLSSVGRFEIDQYGLDRRRVLTSTLMTSTFDQYAYDQFRPALSLGRCGLPPPVERPRPLLDRYLTII